MRTECPKIGLSYTESCVCQVRCAQIVWTFSQQVRRRSNVLERSERLTTLLSLVHLCWVLFSEAPAKRTEHFTEQHWTFVECKMFRAFDHLVEPCSPLLSIQWSLIAIKLFTERMQSDSTFPLFFEMLSVVQCVWPVTEHFSVRAWAVGEC